MALIIIGAILMSNIIKENKFLIKAKLWLDVKSFNKRVVRVLKVSVFNYLLFYPHEKINYFVWVSFWILQYL